MSFFFLFSVQLYSHTNIASLDWLLCNPWDFIHPRSKVFIHLTVNWAPPVMPPSIRGLIQELADYEKMPDGPKISAEELEEDGFGPHKYFHCKVAEDEGKVYLYNISFPYAKINILLKTACWLCPFLLHLLHLGRQVCLHGRPLCSTWREGEGYRHKGKDCNKVIIDWTSGDSNSSGYRTLIQILGMACRQWWS